jgi:hypothetical protein
MPGTGHTLRRAIGVACKNWARAWLTIATRSVTDPTGRPATSCPPATRLSSSATVRYGQDLQQDAANVSQSPMLTFSSCTTPPSPQSTSARASRPTSSSIALTMIQDRSLRLRTKAHRHRRPGKAARRQGDERQGSRQDRVIDGCGFNLGGAYKASL